MSQTTESTPANEFVQRAAAAQDRALTKYGEVAGLPGGHPDYDVIDYAINELAGLPRYIAMIQYRLDQLGVTTVVQRTVLANIAEQARVWGISLIELDRDLRSQGVVLGSREHSF